METTPPHSSQTPSAAVFLSVLLQKAKVRTDFFTFCPTNKYAWVFTMARKCISFFFILFFILFFKLYIIVLVLPNIKMNPPQVYMCSPPWTLLPPPSPYHPSGSSQCTSPKHPVSCIEPGLATRFIHDILHVSMPFSQIFPPSPSLTESIRLFYTLVSLLLSRTQGYCYLSFYSVHTWHNLSGFLLTGSLLNVKTIGKRVHQFSSPAFFPTSSAQCLKQ